MSVVVVATFQPAPDRIDDLVEVLTSVIPAVHAEDGCELYTLNRGKDTLVMIEKWASRDALGVHSKSPALTELGPRLKGLVTAPPVVTVLEPVPAGTAAQGAL